MIKFTLLFFTEICQSLLSNFKFYHLNNKYKRNLNKQKSLETMHWCKVTTTPQQLSIFIDDL